MPFVGGQSNHLVVRSQLIRFTVMAYNSVSQPLRDCGPVNPFFRKMRARSQQIHSSLPFHFFLSSYIKLT